MSNDATQLGTTRTHPPRRWVKRTIWSVVSVVLLLVLVASGVSIWTVQRAFPQTSGELTLAKLTEPVTVYRDADGVPTIEARNSLDLYTAQGFVHAQDRFWEMDFRRHVTAGRVSELFGESQLGTDTFIRTLGWRKTAEAEVAAMDPTSLAYYEAYAAGVNSYLAGKSNADVSLEYSVLALQNSGYTIEPWTPADSVAWLKAMAWDLRSNIEDETDRALLSERLSDDELAELYPAYDYAEHPVIVTGAEDEAGEDASASSETGGTSSQAASAEAPRSSGSDAGTAAAMQSVKASLAGLPQLLGDGQRDVGSNSWVIGGEHTDTGMPLMSNDPHLGASMPSVWYQMNLKCTTSMGCAEDVSGFTFSGLPGVVIGHNAHVSWGFTNLGPDVADLYIERVSGDNYELDGVLKPLEISTETIDVAGGESVDITIRRTERGPIVSSANDDFKQIAEAQPTEPGLTTELSLQWTALSPGKTPEAIFAINNSTDWDSFRAGAKKFEVPAQNLVYADTEGNIGYQAPGKIPVRKQGDGSVPVPGWTSDYGWESFIPFDDLPRTFNPEKGYVVTANNPAVDESYPELLTTDWDYGYRADQIEQRIEEAISGGAKMTAAHVEDIQFDNTNGMAKVLAPAIANLSVEGDAARGTALLADWDYSDDVNSPAAAYFNVFWKNYLNDVVAPQVPEVTVNGGDRWFTVTTVKLSEPDSDWWTLDGITGRDAVLTELATRAYDEASDLLGAHPDSWRWGKLHSLTLTNASFGTSGIKPIEALFNRGPYEVGGGSSIVNANGWRASEGYVVTNVPSLRMVVDLADFDRSRWIHISGASGHAFNPHYADQAPEWANNQSHPWLFSLDGIRKASEDTLVLKPRY
ncbi:penicillin acylase family protein [Lysinibacter cavernae]|uniref:Penicillin amidase n=1 Tax=Lysinibacter cavernae TaxID=1640652 RepID=A0A7X5R187_9MICO|nr:penicillin acylase family protein [Lysinibacter cavernae]NIH53835.1 penicillin amidase [Lysinibacter cavernae]